MKKSDKGIVDGIDWRVWIIYTILYAIGLAFVSGYARTYLPEIAMTPLGPFDVQIWIWVIGLGAWGALTARMFKGRWESGS